MRARLEKAQAVGGLYNPLSLPANWFGMALNVVHRPSICANRVEVGRSGCRGCFGKGPWCEVCFLWFGGCVICVTQSAATYI